MRQIGGSLNLNTNDTRAIGMEAAIWAVIEACDRIVKPCPPVTEFHRSKLMLA